MADLLKQFCVFDGTEWWCMSGGGAPPPPSDEYSIDWIWGPTIYCQKDSGGENTYDTLQYVNGIKLTKTGEGGLPYDILSYIPNTAPPYNDYISVTDYQQLSITGLQNRAAELHSYIISLIPAGATVVDNTTGVEPYRTNATSCPYTPPTIEYFVNVKCDINGEVKGSSTILPLSAELDGEILARPNGSSYHDGKELTAGSSSLAKGTFTNKAISTSTVTFNNSSAGFVNRLDFTITLKILTNDPPYTMVSTGNNYNAGWSISLEGGTYSPAVNITSFSGLKSSSDYNGNNGFIVTGYFNYTPHDGEELTIRVKNNTESSGYIVVTGTQIY
jgi:hypothetical protein